MRGVSSQRVYGSTASFRLQIPLRGSHIPDLNSTITVVSLSDTCLRVMITRNIWQGKGSSDYSGGDDIKC
jgi:hypothetical protein